MQPQESLQFCGIALKFWCDSLNFGGIPYPFQQMEAAKMALWTANFGHVRSRELWKKKTERNRQKVASVPSQF